MKVIRSLLFLIALSTGLPTTAGAGPVCSKDLSLLDAPLIEVLNSLAGLQVDMRFQDSMSPLSVKTEALIREKSLALQAMILDHETLKAARDYIIQKVAETVGAKETLKVMEEQEEDAQRDQESALLNPYVMYHNSYTRVLNQGPAYFTPDSIFIGQADDLHLTLINPWSNLYRKIELPMPESEGAITSYSPNSDELFVKVGNRIVVIKPNDLFNLFQDSRPLSALSFPVVLDLSEETKSEMLGAIDSPQIHETDKQTNLLSIFKSFKSSADGRYLASDFSFIHRPKFNGIMVYDRQTKTFKMVSKLRAESLFSSEWDISGDGKQLAVADFLGVRGTIQWADLDKGVQEIFRYKSQTVVFGHQGKIMAVNDGPYKVLVLDRERGDTEIFDLSNLIKSKRQEARPDKISFSPDDTKLIVGNSLGKVWIWDLKTKELMTSFAGRGSSVGASRSRVFLSSREPQKDRKGKIMYDLVFFWQKAL